MKDQQWVFGECHGHIFMDGLDYQGARARYQQGIDRKDIHRKLKAYQAAGVTFFRDGGDIYGAGVYARSVALSYGIDYRTPVFALHLASRYGSIVGRAYENLTQYRERISQVRAAGGDFIKLMLSGLLDFAGDGSVTGTPYSPALIDELIHIAHEEGFAVMAHVNADKAVRACIEAGADSVEHGGWMGEETLQALAESKTVWVPTYSAIHNLLAFDRFSRTTVEMLDRMHRENIRKAFELGALLAAGSDAGAFSVPHPKGIADESTALLQILEEFPDARQRLIQGEQKIRLRFRRPDGNVTENLRFME